MSAENRLCKNGFARVKHKGVHGRGASGIVQSVEKKGSKGGKKIRRIASSVGALSGRDAGGGGEVIKKRRKRGKDVCMGSITRKLALKRRKKRQNLRGQKR